MSNKPLLPNSYVDVNNRNLGLSPGAPSGIFAFIGQSVDGSAAADAIVSVGKNDVAALIGYGSLANELIDFFDNGGRKAYAVPVVPDTLVSGYAALTPTRVGVSAGTITSSLEGGEVVPDGFELHVEITKTGIGGVGRMKISLDAGTTFMAEMLIPITAGTYVIPGTHIELTFADVVTGFDDGDVFDQSITGPQPLAGDVTDAVDTLIASDYTFDAIIVCDDVSAATGAVIDGKMEGAEDSPDFRYSYSAFHGALAAANMSDMLSIYTTIRASVESDRAQVCAAEATMVRPNYGNAQYDKTCIGALAGRRSALNLQNDLGLFSAGSLVNVVSLRTNMTETLIEDLDAIQCVTVRKFKGVAGLYPTNGWMSDPFSDITKDARRLVLDKASRIARLTGLGKLKIEVDPSDISGSTESLKNDIQNALDTQIVGNNEAVSVTVDIPDDQDILTTEELDVEIEVQVYGHASYIGITVQISNPAAA